MKVLIWGLSSQQGENPMIEICLYLLVHAVILIIIGRVIEKSKIDGEYMRQIRYAKQRVWRQQMSMRVTGMTLILVSIIFFACYIVVVIQDESVKSWGKEAYILWLLFFSNINVIQLLCINLAGGSKWCFAIIMLIEVLSISIPILPGSYVMLCRSEKILEGGFRLDICVLVEIFLLLILSMEGYRLLRTGGRKYGQRHTGRKSNKDF